MSNIWTLTDGSRSVVDAVMPGLVCSQEPRRAHKRYVAVDPAVVARRLESDGFRTHAVYGSARRANLRSPRTAILEVTDPDGTMSEHGEGYVAACRIYFDHRGRSAILIAGGPLRCECRNAFVYPDFRIHHCSPEAEEFLHDPRSFVAPVLRRARSKLTRLEALRNRPGGLVVPAFLAAEAPRLASRVRAVWGEYEILGGSSWWTALQALTAARSRRLDEFAGAILAAPRINEEAPWLTLNACWN